MIDELVLSTDDEAIASVGKEYGAGVPFMRPLELAQDKTPSREVVLYTIDRLNQKREKEIKEFVLLQPTSPLRTGQDIVDAVKLFREKKAEAVISVSEAHHPPVWARRVSPDGRLSDYFPAQAEVHSRQEAEKAYYPNGAIYIFNYEYYKRNNGGDGRVFAYQMPKERSIDIDDQYDFKLANYLLGGK
jgi:CMP-N,N'-diacetyllegionaminic acid synthase